MKAQSLQKIRKSCKGQHIHKILKTTFLTADNTNLVILQIVIIATVTSLINVHKNSQ